MAATAGDVDFIVCWMNIGFHRWPLFHFRAQILEDTAGLCNFVFATEGTETTEWVKPGFLQALKSRLCDLCVLCGLKPEFCYDGCVVGRPLLLSGRNVNPTVGTAPAEFV